MINTITPANYSTILGKKASAKLGPDRKDRPGGRLPPRRCPHDFADAKKDTSAVKILALPPLTPPAAGLIHPAHTTCPGGGIG
ncbi:hypothetical protein, partial [Paracoccus sp. (in: a-proteobacteria)]|uniref:hypothetical protein n=1 Tax=Paracoccus sp. TaxID=267 RepID=UPI0035B4832E